MVIRFLISDPLYSTGATYRFRIVAVYSNNDNKQGQNSARFTLEVVPAMRPRVPSNKPVIVEAKSLRSDSIQIKWQVRPNDVITLAVSGTERGTGTRTRTMGNNRTVLFRVQCERSHTVSYNPLVLGPCPGLGFGQCVWAIRALTFSHK